jgi:OOP family OmpA-OmpF porin
MFRQLALALTIVFGAASAFAQQSVTDIHAKTQGGTYLQDGRGVITRSGSGLCWRSSHWTPADAVIGCDGELVLPVANPTAPTAAPMAPAPVAVRVPAPMQCDFKATFGNDEIFGFNKAVLGAVAKQRIDREVLEKLATCTQMYKVLVIGHADRMGPQQYNQKLSEKRANAVAGFF